MGCLPPVSPVFRVAVWYPAGSFWPRFTRRYQRRFLARIGPTLAPGRWDSPSGSVEFRLGGANPAPRLRLHVRAGRETLAESGNQSALRASRTPRPPALAEPDGIPKPFSGAKATRPFLLSLTVVHRAPPHKNIDAIGPRRGKRSDYHDTDHAQNNHYSRNLKQSHVHGKTPHSPGVATTKRNQHRAWQHSSHLRA